MRDFGRYNLFMRLMPIGLSILTDSKESLIQNAWYSRFCLRSVFYGIFVINPFKRYFTDNLLQDAMVLDFPCYIG